MSSDLAFAQGNERTKGYSPLLICVSSPFYPWLFYFERNESVRRPRRHVPVRWALP